jgi:methyltransferase (TIGR00027 family)
VSLPDLSYMMTVGETRYIQSIYEPTPDRNPDDLVGNFLAPLQRWKCRLQARLQLQRLRAKPFYYYLLARTRYYDSLFLGAARAATPFIVNIGCGVDTRVHRYHDVLVRNKVSVLECDQPQAIRAKERLARKLWPSHDVAYLPIDLNQHSWPDFERWLGERAHAATLVLMEGVSPYIATQSFGRFLELLSANLAPNSCLAYDFKLRGVAEDFGKSARTPDPFRLSVQRDQIIDYHRLRGYEVRHLEFSGELCEQTLAARNTPLFREDGLIQLVPDGNSRRSNADPGESTPLPQ